MTDTSTLLIEMIEKVQDEKAKEFLNRCLVSDDLDEDMITDRKYVFLNIPYLKAIKSPAKNIPNLLKIKVREEEITFEQARVIPLVFFKKRNFLVKTEAGWDIAKRFVTDEKIKELSEFYKGVATRVITTFDVVLYDYENGRIFINEGKGADTENTRRHWNELLFKKKREIGVRAYMLEATVKPKIVKNENYEYAIPVYSDIKRTNFNVDTNLVELIREYINMRINPKAYRIDDSVIEEEKDTVDSTTDDEIPF